MTGQSIEELSIVGKKKKCLLSLGVVTVVTSSFFIQPLSISERPSMKKDLLVFAVWNLIFALQSPHCLPHVLGLQWWCVSPLFANI